MILNDVEKIAKQCWENIPKHFPNVLLHSFVIMPNHLHGIIEIISSIGAKDFSPLPNGTAKTIGSMVRGFKIGITKQIGFSLWQRNYHKHIIRNEQSYFQISEYIEYNPLKWEDDCFYR